MPYEVLLDLMIISSFPKYNENPPCHPSRVVKNDYGKCLVAVRDLGRGEIVERYEGPVVPSYADVPLEEIRHALITEDNQYIIVLSNARYINHSCDPNCIIDDDYLVRTIRPVRKGEEITIRYNDIDLKHDGEDLFWDPRWTFTCRCGSENCLGKIDRYVIYDKLPKKKNDSNF
jgi:hypothetical protein